MSVSMTREWSMPSRNTFTMAPVNRLIRRWMGAPVKGIWIDPFARNSPFNQDCKETNDLSPDADVTYHLEALDFLKRFVPSSIDGMLFDPPYSPRQISECYKGIGRKTHATDTQSSFYGDRKNAAATALRKGGIVICCGWNSGGFGKSRGFDLVEVLLVPHGGAHNDTIVTVEVKTT